MLKSTTEEPTSRAVRAVQMAPPTPQIHLGRLTWENKLLLILGLVIGLAGGYLHFVQSPEIYLSSAKVQIVENYSRNLPVQGLDSKTSSSDRDLADEALVMRSERILVKAADLGHLDESPAFAGRAPLSIAGELGGSPLLTIGPATKDAKSIYLISYKSTDPVSSQQVVQSIVDAYSAHIEEQHLNVGRQTLELIREARGEVFDVLNELEKEYDQFKQSSELVFRSGKPSSRHREQADDYSDQRKRLLVRKTQLESVLRTAEQSLEAGIPAESVLIALNDRYRDSVGVATAATIPSVATEAERTLAALKEQNRLTRSESLRESQLIPLEMERQQLLEAFGAGHPSINSIQIRIDLVKDRIAEMAKSEAEYAAKLEAATKAANESLSSDTDIDYDPSAELERAMELQLLALKQQIESVKLELEVVTQSYEHESKAAKSESGVELTAARYERDIGRQRALYDRIVARLDEVNILADNARLKVFTLDTPKQGYQVAPVIYKSMLMGAVLGLMAAGGLAYLRELSDKSYHSAEQIAEHLRAPVIGHIPLLKPDRRAAKQIDSALDPSLCAFYKSKGSGSEAYKSIRTALYFSNQAGGQKILQVTSPTPADGKSTVASNIAIAIAQSGKSVLLLDADLRRPMIQKLFGIEAERGFAWLLGESATCESDEKISELLGEVIHETEVENLAILGAGSRPDNPAELLSSRHFDRVLDAVRDKFDIIILDSPPLLAVTDPSNVAARVDGVLMVVRLRKNIKPVAAQATRMIETLETNLIGVVVNGVGSRQARGYGKYGAYEGYRNRGQYYTYGYGYTYGSDGRYKAYYDDDKEKNGKSRTHA